MKYRELDYSRNFNLGNYESERITLKVDLDETEDLDESYKTLKATVFRLQKEGGLIEDSKKVVESTDFLELSVLPHFSKELVDLVFFEVTKDAVIIKTRGFLGSDAFAKIASIVRELKGEYCSRGKDSHFKIPKK